MSRIYTHASPSQIDTFELCPRKWAWDKIDGKPGKQNKYAAFGSRTHKILEAWFLNGTPPPNTPEGKTAKKILRHLPPPQTEGITVERSIDLELGGVKIKGYVDFSILDAKPRPFISDHKTTGGFHWALTAETMHEDVQVSSYGYEAMLRTNAREVDAQWTYGHRNGKKSLPVVRAGDNPITYEQIKPRLEKSIETVRTMRDIFESDVTAIEVPYNALGCDAYGGCPYEDLCNLTAHERFRSLMAQEKQEKSFLNKLRNKKKQNGAAEAAAPTPPTEEPKTEVPASKGTVNPPSAPETAPASPPEDKPAEKKKSRRGGRRKKADTPPKTEAAPTPAVPTAPTPPSVPVDVNASATVVMTIDQVIATYQRGVRDGVEFVNTIVAQTQGKKP